MTLVNGQEYLVEFHGKKILAKHLAFSDNIHPEYFHTFVLDEPQDFNMGGDRVRMKCAFIKDSELSEKVWQVEQLVVAR